MGQPHDTVRDRLSKVMSSGWARLTQVSLRIRWRCLCPAHGARGLSVTGASHQGRLRGTCRRLRVTNGLQHLETGISVQEGWVPKGPGCLCHCNHANSRAQSLQEACLRLACWVQLAFCLLKVLEHLLKQLD